MVSKMCVPASSGDTFVERKIFVASPSHIYICQLALASPTFFQNTSKDKQLSVSDKIMCNCAKLWDRM